MDILVFAFLVLVGEQCCPKLAQSACNYYPWPLDPPTANRGR